MTAPLATVGARPIATSRVLTVLAIVPLAWAVLLLFHQDPGGGDVYDSLRDSPSRWLLVHLGSMVFIGLIAGVLWFVLADVTGPAASIARLAIVPFVLFYGAGEAVLGVATAVLTQHANDVPVDDQPAAAAAVQALWDDFVTADLLIGIGSIAWVVAVVSTSAALWATASAARRRGPVGRLVARRVPCPTDRSHRSRLLRRRHRPRRSHRPIGDR